MKIQLFNIPNLLTAGNLIAGCLSILFALSGRIELAALFILIGAIFDFLDGFAARLLKQQSPIGKQLDSLADIVTFGVAPAFIVFVLAIIFGAKELLLITQNDLSQLWMDGTMGANIQSWINIYLSDLSNNFPEKEPFFVGWYLYLPFVAFLIPMMSLFRLAKFNVDDRQTDAFIGLPTPANSLFFASFALMLWDGFGTSDWRASLSLTLISDQIMMVFVIIFSYLLIAEIRLFSLKFKNFSWQDNKTRYLFLLFSLISISLLFVWALPVIILTYLLVSVFTAKA